MSPYAPALDLALEGLHEHLLTVHRLTDIALTTVEMGRSDAALDLALADAGKAMTAMLQTYEDIRRLRRLVRQGGAA